jgi:methionine-rich copper-binding protein CopC
MPRSARWVAVLIVTAIAGVGWFPGAALAAESLVSAIPAAGTALAAAPGAVTLRFSARIAVDDSHVAVSTGRGDGLAAGDLDQTGPNEVRLRIRPSSPGDLTVAYHVIFAGGAGATGAYRFSVGTGIAPAPLSDTAQTALGEATAGHGHGVDPIGATLLVIDGGVLLVALVLLMVRPRRGAGGPANTWRYRED